MRTLRLLIPIAGFACAALLTMAKDVSPQGKGNEAKGRYYFRQTCKECHTKGAKGGEVTPLTKTMAQWGVYFTKGKHNGIAGGLEKILPADQLRDAQTFLVNHAADSPQPETCGK